MSKNIVIFCDGTWNSPTDEEFGTPAPTNVHLLYQVCLNQAESIDPQTDQIKQITWYESGVGSLGSAFKRSFEGATGTGLGVNIRRGYLAIAWHYEPGDRIFLFGFSRGAFTARSIAGMIRQIGLLKNPTEDSVAQAYRDYKSKRYHYTPAAVENADLRSPGNVRVHFIGVWDTVGSLGFSFWGWSFNLRWFFKNGFHDLSPNSITDNVYHALAMDEIRTSFMPSLWELPESQSGEPKANYIEQAWFRGVHSDVGGGYAERGLSDITLDWMARNAQAKGLLLRPNAFQTTGTDATLKLRPAGRIHRSYQGPLWTNVGGWPRWFPPLIREPTHRKAPAGGYLHPSVFEREKICAQTGSSELPMRQLTVNEPIRVEVRADELWNNTGLILEAGATYKLQASGYWQDAGGTPTGPEGQPPGTEFWGKRLMRWARRAPKYPWMHLVGIVNYPRTWIWKERPLSEAFHFLILEDPQELVNDLFSIGREGLITIKVNRTGLLWVFANDMWKAYANNTGALVLTVTRVATS